MRVAGEWPISVQRRSAAISTFGLAREITTVAGITLTIPRFRYVAEFSRIPSYIMMRAANITHTKPNTQSAAEE